MEHFFKEFPFKLFYSTLLCLAVLWGLPTTAWGQNPTRKPPIEKKQSARSAMKRLFKGPKHSKRKKRDMSRTSDAFSGENMATPSQGWLQRRDRQMNRKAKEGAYLDLKEHKRRKANMSYTSLGFSGHSLSSSFNGKAERAEAARLGQRKRKNNMRGSSVRVKKRRRPVADKLAGKRRFRLPRLSRKHKPKLKYDKKEREIWAR